MPNVTTLNHFPTNLGHSAKAYFGSAEEGAPVDRQITAENAVGAANIAPARPTSIKAGDRVIFKQASLGFYFIRIDGQMGIKGKRIQ